jgi:hypothetical protein
VNIGDISKLSSICRRLARTEIGLLRAGKSPPFAASNASDPPTSLGSIIPRTQARLISLTHEALTIIRGSPGKCSISPRLKEPATFVVRCAVVPPI